VSVRLAYSGPGITGALRPGRKVPEPRSSMAAPRPTRTTTSPPPPLFDWQAHDERPSLPLLVELSLSVLVAHARNPVGHDRARVLEAAGHVEAWVQGREADWTPPHGIDRGDMT